MASEVKADKLSPSSGTTLSLGDASDEVKLVTGVSLNVVDGIGVASGGTGLASFTAGDVLYATGTTTLAKLAKGSAEQVLSMNSGATAPEWATAAATAGGTGQTGFTAGDLLYANSTTTLTKLAKGTGLQGLQTNSGATAPEWTNSPQSLMTAAGDILYASGANTLAKLAKGSNDEVLTLAAGVPSWAAGGSGAILKGASLSVTAAESSTGTTPSNLSSYDLAFQATASDSKLWLQATLNISNSDATTLGYFYNSTAGEMAGAIGDADGPKQRGMWRSLCTNNAFVMSMTYGTWYEPGNTTNNTYQIFGNANAGTTMYINRSGDTTDNDNINYSRTASVFTILEFAASVITLS